MPAAPISEDPRRPVLVRRIAEYRELNEQNELSGKHACVRACGGCGEATPERRFLATACYHAVCRECADGKAECPLCEKRTSFVRLYEEKSCGVCACEAPIRWGGFTACGHTICGACSMQLLVESMDNGIQWIACPYCRTISPLRPIKTEE